MCLIVGIAQELLITLVMVLFHSSVPVSRDSEWEHLHVHWYLDCDRAYFYCIIEGAYSHTFHCNYTLYDYTWHIKLEFGVLW